MAKVITTVLKFPDDQTQKILEREDSRPMVSFTNRLLIEDDFILSTYILFCLIYKDFELVKEINFLFYYTIA